MCNEVLLRTEVCIICVGFLAYVGVSKEHSLSHRLRVKNAEIRVKVSSSINDDKIFLLKTNRFHNEVISKCNYKSHHDMSLFKFYVL